MYFLHVFSFISKVTKYLLIIEYDDNEEHDNSMAWHLMYSLQDDLILFNGFILSGEIKEVQKEKEAK